MKKLFEGAWGVPNSTPQPPEVEESRGEPLAGVLGAGSP